MEVWTEAGLYEPQNYDEAFHGPVLQGGGVGDGLDRRPGLALGERHVHLAVDGLVPVVGAADHGQHLVYQPQIGVEQHLPYGRHGHKGRGYRQEICCAEEMAPRSPTSSCTVKTP